MIKHKLASIFFIFLAIMSHVSHAVDVDCSTQIQLQKQADGVIKKLGLIPDFVLGEKIAKGIHAAEDTISAIKRIRGICESVQSKDGVAAYFFVLKELARGVPGAGKFVGEQLKMGQKIIDEANNIASNLAFAGLYETGAEGLAFAIRVSKNGCSTRWWSRCDWFSTTEVHRNIEEATIFYKTNSGEYKQTVPLELCSKNNCSDMDNNRSAAYFIDTGVAISESGEAGLITEAYFKVKWKSGQVSMVPLKTGYVSASRDQFYLQFNNDDKYWFEYKY